jgi:ribosomal protein S18 acetylase RimI-like enzyme
VIDQAANSGYRAVDVTVFADNAPMLRLLLGLGFIPVRIKHHLRADGGDLVYLKLYLSGSPGEEPA